MKIVGFDHALQALGPYLDDLVVGGAWAWYLYRRCLGSDNWMPSEFTRDVDCIGHEGMPVRDIGLFDRLEKAAFVWVPRGHRTPPVAHFAWPSEKKADVEIEFLVPARGDGSRSVVEIQRNVTAQALRHLEILRDEPLEILVDDGSPLSGQLEFRGTVRLPSLGRFVVQKAVIHSRRDPPEQFKDMFYVFDLIDAENGLADLVLDDVLRTEVRWAKEVARFKSLLYQRLGEPPFLRAMADQLPQERRPSMAYVEQEIRDWLGRLERASDRARNG